MPDTLVPGILFPPVSASLVASGGFAALWDVQQLVCLE